jgi:hypothetical protein
MRRRSKPADRLAHTFRTIVFFVVLIETAALAYLLTRPKPDARSEFLVEPGRNHSLMIDDERFAIPARPGQKIVVTVENPKSGPPPQAPISAPPPRDDKSESSIPKEPRFRFYYDTREGLKWFRLGEKLDTLRGSDDWQTALNVVRWTREQFEPGTPGNYTQQNAAKLLPLLRSGKEQGGAAQYSFIAAQALQALDLRARYVSIAGHQVVEVWLPSHGRWIVVDPMNAVHFEDARGRKLSALEVAKKRAEARPVPKTDAPTAQAEAYRVLVYWLRNDLYLRPLNMFDLNRWTVRAILDPSELAQLAPGDLYTFFPEELYTAPPREPRVTAPAE